MKLRALLMAAFLFPVVAFGACTPTGCPKDLPGSVGKRCAPEGAQCGTDSAGFTHFIQCSRGKWVEFEAPPPPQPGMPVPETGCPSDPAASVGKACAIEGAHCGTEAPGFTHFITCMNGKWVEFEAPPPPPPPPPSAKPPVLR